MLRIMLQEVYTLLWPTLHHFHYPVYYPFIDFTTAILENCWSFQGKIAWPIFAIQPLRQQHPNNVDGKRKIYKNLNRKFWAKNHPHKIA